MRHFKIIAFTLSVLLLSTNTANAADAQPDAAAMQKAMMLGAPSEHHKILDALVGEWTYTSKFWMMPDAEPETATGTTSSKWILDGRFIHEDVSGNMKMGDLEMAFNGLGLLGYDNVKEEYTSIWIDNMMTGTMLMPGKYDAATKTITFTGNMSCPMTGEKEKPVRSTLKLDSANHVYTMYTIDPSGKEFKGMEITYTKK